MGTDASGLEGHPADFSVELRDRLAGAPPIVCFANDWRGDPTSKHHIMATFAQHTDVLWVESAGMRRPKLSRTTDLRRLIGRLKRSVGGLTRAHDRLSVLSPLSLPLPGSRLATSVNARLYQRAIRRTLRLLGMRRDPLLWVYTPTVAPYVAAMPRSGLVYHCVDRWWAFSDYDPDVMRRCHEDLCRQADVVFASSAELLDDCLRFTAKAHLIRHGVEWDHFARAALSPPPRPADLMRVDGPILGFFGLIHEWIDQDLLCRLADAIPEATLVLIGRVQVDVSRLEAKRNIRLLGQKPYAELPAYAAAFDVGLIPFAINDLTRAVNPIKLREYLSAGMPVVATALPEIVLLADNPMVQTAATPEEFVEAVSRFLRSVVTNEDRKGAAIAMASESWPGRCAEMAMLIRSRIPTMSAE